ncbi:MAG TPA: hypothetical protein VNO13_00015 [Candidatus Udaeobacter sp.]|nr:hypothetical protein [Candidatus Udaeobacter sp.]
MPITWNRSEPPPLRERLHCFLRGFLIYFPWQIFNGPGFTGAVDIPLHQGRNEVLLALSELGGGWGFICRLTDLAH